jgi:peptidoglycan hydrolase-like protein with peptidoglycan-binding domain
MQQDIRFMNRHSTRGRFTSRLFLCLLVFAGIVFPGTLVEASGQDEPTVAHRPRRVTKKASKARKARITATEIREAEQFLSDLGYWTGRIDGTLDEASRHALVAFQKVEGRETTGRLTLEELGALREAGPPEPLEGGKSHIEVDLSRQVLFVVEEDGTVSRVLPVSTGNDKFFSEKGFAARAYTPRGRFAVDRKIAGWHESVLGLLYYPNYILGGVAIHGSPSMPAYPDSHGCIRIPLFAAKTFSELTPAGTPVLIHEGGSFANVSVPWPDEKTGKAMTERSEIR